MKKQFNIRTYKVEDGKFVKGGFKTFEFGLVMRNNKMFICINNKLGSRITLEQITKSSIKSLLLSNINKYMKNELTHSVEYSSVESLKKRWGNGARLKRIRKKFLIDLTEESRDRLSNNLDNHLPYENN